MSIENANPQSTSIIFNFLYASTALFTGALSFIVGKYWDVLFERRKHKNKYHEKIIEKRISYCEMIDFSLRPLMVTSVPFDDIDGPNYIEAKRSHNVLLYGYKRTHLFSAAMLNKMDISGSSDLILLDTYLEELNYANSFSAPWVRRELSQAFHDLINYSKVAGFTRQIAA